MLYIYYAHAGARLRAAPRERFFEGASCFLQEFVKDLSNQYETILNGELGIRVEK